jgi:membrane protein implicated in regulation of membrane protease activity
MWSRQVILRYSLLQLLEIVLLLLILALLRQWINIPMWAVGTFTSLLVMINIIIYPFVWRAYDTNPPNSICGSQGIAADRLSPCGFVRINGELWHAKISDDNSVIAKGEVVTVKDRSGFTLIVQPGEK